MPAPSNTFEFTSGMKINLKSGESIHFLNTAYGTSFAVSEDASANYTPNKTGVGGSTVAGSFTSYAPSDQGAAFSAPAQVLTAGTDNLMNQIKVENNYQSTALTGVLIDNLPYVLIVALALGVGVAYVVVKSRSRKVRTQVLGE